MTQAKKKITFEVELIEGGYYCHLYVHDANGLEHKKVCVTEDEIYKFLWKYMPREKFQLKEVK